MASPKKATRKRGMTIGLFSDKTAVYIHTTSIALPYHYHTKYDFYKGFVLVLDIPLAHSTTLTYTLFFTIILCPISPPFCFYRTTIKHNVTVKVLWGYSENVVRTQTWIAIYSYLLLAKIKYDMKSPYSITKIATLIRVSALERKDLKKLLTRPNHLITFNQNVKEHSF